MTLPLLKRRRLICSQTHSHLPLIQKNPWKTYAKESTSSPLKFMRWWNVLRNRGRGAASRVNPTCGVKPGHDRSIERGSLSRRALASNSARLNFTLSPHNFHALVESCGHNRRGYIAWGIGDASIGHFPGHQSRLVAPPLSTGAALYARPGAEVVRASRPISPSE